MPQEKKKPKVSGGSRREAIERNPSPRRVRLSPAVEEFYGMDPVGRQKAKVSRIVAEQRRRTGDRRNTILHKPTPKASTPIKRPPAPTSRRRRKK